MNTVTINPYVVFVGSDWADTKHDVCIRAVGSMKREFAVSDRKNKRDNQDL